MLPGSRSLRRTLVPVGAAAGFLTVSVLVFTLVDYQLAGAVMIGPLLLLASYPLIVRARAKEPDPWVARLFFPGLLAMLAAGLVRYWFSFAYSDGRVDAAKYGRDALAVAEQIRAGDLWPTLDGAFIGNGATVLVTAVVFAIFGPTLLGAFMVWSGIGFWGLYLCYRAFRTGMPAGDHRRYALLIFFFPSLLFWSAAVGKEAWMIFFIGTTLLGIARLLAHQRAALVLILGGTAGASLVRPHVAILLYSALLIGLAIRRSLAADRLGPFMKFVLILLLLPGGFVLLDQTGSFLGLDTLSTAAVSDLLADQAAQTSTVGSSAFTAGPAGGPLTWPSAAVTVLVRPFPWEANSPQLVLSSVEGVVLVALTVLTVRRVVRIRYLGHGRAYAVVAAVYLVAFVIAFSSLGNFGLLVRERIQALPLMFVLLAMLPAIPRPGLGRRGDHAAERGHSSPHMGRAGTPATTVPSPTSRVTTAPEPTKAHAFTRRP